MNIRLKYPKSLSFRVFKDKVLLKYTLFLRTFLIQFNIYVYSICYFVFALNCLGKNKMKIFAFV